MMSSYTCEVALGNLYTPIALTLNLLLGVEPPPPEKFKREKAYLKNLHDDCLRITGILLVAIDRRVHL